VRSFQAYKE